LERSFFRFFFIIFFKLLFLFFSNLFKLKILQLNSFPTFQGFFKTF
jgi:hypothetical protein